MKYGMMFIMAVIVSACGSETTTTCADVGNCVVELSTTVAAQTTSDSISIEFASNDEKVVSFECSLDDAAAAACTSPYTASGLAYGDHHLDITGLDADGNTGTELVVTWSRVVTTDTSVPNHVVINEFLASNDTDLQDDEGDFEDWIELWNPTTQAVDLGGMFMSDDATDLMAHEISAGVSIEPGEYLILFADKDTEDGPLHLDIKLSREGEDVLLVDTDGTTVIDQVLAFPEQTTDVSYGRQPDGTDTFTTFTTTTPGASNN